MKLSKLIEKTIPAKLAKIRGKRQETSTRDKARFIKKVEEVEQVVKKLGYKIMLEDEKQRRSHK